MPAPLDGEFIAVTTESLDVLASLPEYFSSVELEVLEFSLVLTLETAWH